MADFVPAFDVVSGANAEKTAFVLHGILGSARNWRTFARRLARAYPDWRFVLVDLRNHGESEGAPPPHTLAACAADLDRLAAREGRPNVVIGHSFGGKVAMAYGRDFPQGTDAIWVLDAAPSRGDAAALQGEVVGVIRALQAMAMPVPRREDVVERLRALGFSDALAAWMTTNLEPVEGGFSWRFDLAAVKEMLASYHDTDLLPFLATTALDVHLVRAGRSDRWPASLVRQLEALPAVTLHVLPEAGHWVHVDDPEGLLALLGETLAL